MDWMGAVGRRVLEGREADVDAEIAGLLGVRIGGRPDGHRQDTGKCPQRVDGLARQRLPLGVGRVLRHELHEREALDHAPYYTEPGIGAILAGMLKRVALFLAVNLLVVLTISILLNVLGVRPYLTARGIDYQALLVFCLVWGMGGAFISLGLSRIMAKYAMGVQVVDPQTTNAQGQALLQAVARLTR